MKSPAIFLLLQSPGPTPIVCCIDPMSALTPCIITCSLAKRAWLDLLGLILLLIFIALLTIKSVTVFTDSLEFNSTAMTTLATPLWIPQLFWLSGLIFFLFTLVFITCYTLVALLHRDLQTVARIAGVMSVEEELEEEVQGTNIVTKHMPHSQQES